jgi:hypothetical protein
MKNQFTSYEIALKLKKLGFDEECLCVYDSFNVLIGAPSYQQIIDWFRSVHKIHITITSQSQESWQWHIQFPHDSLNKMWQEDFNSYEEARENVILKAIELISK